MIPGSATRVSQTGDHVVTRAVLAHTESIAAAAY